MDGGKVFGIAAKVERTVLTVVPPIENASVVVQLVGDGGAINFHAGGKDDEIVPLTHHVQKIVEVRSFVDEEAHGMLVDHHFQHEVGRCPWFDGLSYDAVVVRVDQRFVQVEHQHLALDHGEALPRNG